MAKRCFIIHYFQSSASYVLFDRLVGCRDNGENIGATCALVSRNQHVATLKSLMDMRIIMDAVILKMGFSET